MTEAVDEPALDLVEKYADVIQIGTRNMQNFSLLRRAGRLASPCCLSVQDVFDARRVSARGGIHHRQGNYQVILCERGVKHSATIRASRPICR